MHNGLLNILHVVKSLQLIWGDFFGSSINVIYI